MYHYNLKVWTFIHKVGYVTLSKIIINLISIVTVPIYYIMNKFIILKHTISDNTKFIKICVLSF